MTVRTLGLKFGEQGKNPSRVAAGLKAAVRNPRVSEEAKESASERLHQMGAGVEATQTAPASETAGGGSRSPGKVS